MTDKRHVWVIESADEDGDWGPIAGEVFVGRRKAEQSVRQLRQFERVMVLMVGPCRYRVVRYVREEVR